MKNGEPIYKIKLKKKKKNPVKITFVHINLEKKGGNKERKIRLYLC